MIRQHFFVLVHIDSSGSTDCKFLLKDKVIFLLVGKQPNKSPVYAKWKLQSPNLLSLLIQSRCFCVANCNSQFLLANPICIWLIICLVALGTLNRAGLFCWRLYYPSAAKHGCDIIHSIYPKTTTTTTKSLLMGMQCFEGGKIIWHFIFQCLLLVLRKKNM